MDGFLLRVLAALQVGPPPRPRVRRWRPALRGLSSDSRHPARGSLSRTRHLPGSRPTPAPGMSARALQGMPRPRSRMAGALAGALVDTVRQEHAQRSARAAQWVHAGYSCAPQHGKVVVTLNPKSQPIAQARPDVMEVEVSPSGDWRVPGEAAWRSILAPAPAAAGAGAGAAARVKAEAPCERAAGAAAAGALGADGGGGGARARTPCPIYPVAFAATCGSAAWSQPMWYATRVLPASVGSDPACLRSRATGPWHARARAACVTASTAAQRARAKSSRCGA